MCKLDLKNDSRRIDNCMKNAIFILKKRFKINTGACCCGHGKYNMTIVIKDKLGVYELFSGEEILRKKKFYKKDMEGFYFIPEIKEYWRKLR